MLFFLLTTRCRCLNRTNYWTNQPSLPQDFSLDMFWIVLTRFMWIPTFAQRFFAPFRPISWETQLHIAGPFPDLLEVVQPRVAHHVFGLAAANARTLALVTVGSWMWEFVRHGFWVWVWKLQQMHNWRHHQILDMIGYIVNVFIIHIWKYGTTTKFLAWVCPKKLTDCSKLRISLLDHPLLGFKTTVGRPTGNIDLWWEHSTPKVLAHSSHVATTKNPRLWGSSATALTQQNRLHSPNPPNPMGTHSKHMGQPWLIGWWWVNLPMYETDSQFGSYLIFREEQTKWFKPSAESWLRKCYHQLRQ